jgi:hypothetical protein
MGKVNPIPKELCFAPLILNHHIMAKPNPILEINKKQRPGFVTVVCVLLFLGIALAIFNYGSEHNKRIGDWYAPYNISFVLIQGICAMGMWSMKRWGFLGYIILVVTNIMVHLSIGYWSIPSLLLFGIVCYYLFKAMPPKTQNSSLLELTPADRECDLNRLIALFDGDFEPERLADLESYVDAGEGQIAIEILSAWIYDEDVAVSNEQEHAILKSSRDYGIAPAFHVFIGRTPPYPDLRTPEQVEVSERAQITTMENVKFLAQRNHMISAIKMYRQITGADLAEAVASVKIMAESPSKDDL